MSKLTKHPKRSQDTASRVIENEAVIVIPGLGLVRVLNEVASRIWQLLDGRNPIEGIIRIISSEFNVSLEVAKKDTLDFIKELKDKKMVVSGDE